MATMIVTPVRRRIGRRMENRVVRRPALLRPRVEKAQFRRIPVDQPGWVG
jgi:hypothetical protein